MGTILLIGHGIGYSASPAMQAAGLHALGLDHEYRLADVPDDRLGPLVDDLRTDGYVGANVTTPHKVRMASLLDDLSREARELGAVNTITRRGDTLYGTNTDLPAIAEAIEALRPRARRAVILGTGGASRAVMAALLRAGAQRVTSASRSEGWDELPRILPEADLLINTTPVGTGTDESPIPAALLHEGLAVLDLVYRPSPTRLVRDARATGAPARGGAGVLLGQGWRSLVEWFGVEPPIEQMRASLRDELGPDADV